jgi:hypothetical protein
VPYLFSSRRELMLKLSRFGLTFSRTRKKSWEAHDCGFDKKIIYKIPSIFRNAVNLANDR